MTLGLFFVRKRRRAIGAPASGFRAWNTVLIFALLVNVYILALPWVPPDGGIRGGDVSFFYATYCIVGMGILLICGLVYVFLIQILPRVNGYSIRQVTDKLSDGALTNRLVKIPNSELAQWDATHDEHGNIINQS